MDVPKLNISFQEMHKHDLSEGDKEFESKFLAIIGSAIDKHFYSKVVEITFNNSDGTNRQDLVKECRVFEFVDLYREPQNRADPNAVCVATKAGSKLGYLDRHAASEIARDFDVRGKVWLAMVRAVSLRSKDRTAGVVLCLCRLTEDEFARLNWPTSLI
jgi:hypothetical protein